MNYKKAEVSINNFTSAEHYFIYVKYDEDIENIEEAISRTEDLSNIQWMVTDLRDASTLNELIQRIGNKKMNSDKIEEIMNKINNIINDNDLSDYEFLLHIKEISKEIN